LMPDKKQTPVAVEPGKKATTYDINKLEKTQPYTFPENVSSIKKAIQEGGPNAVPPIRIRVHHERVLIVDGHHRFKAFQDLGFKRVPIKYVRGNELGKVKSDGSYAPSIEELLEGTKYVE